MKPENKRAKQVREELGLSQKAFAERMGLSRDVISNIEYDRTDLKEYVAKAICREYKVNYLWLVEGKGEPYSSVPDSLFDEIQKEYDLNSDDVLILKEYSELDRTQRNRLKKYIQSMIET